MSVSKHDLYEHCVQNTRASVSFLRAVHGANPRVLGEDFAGTAALSHRWVELTGGTAVAVDLDAETLAYRGTHPSIEKLAADVRAVTTPCDALFVGNFSIGYFHARAELVGYLRCARSRLNPGGFFACDTYGGETAFLVGDVHREHPIAGGEPLPSLEAHAGKMVRYTWEQREADASTGMVTDVIHFRIENGGRIEDEFEDAFVYRWRLWSIPELRDAMLEAGFGAVEVYDKTCDARDEEGNVYVTPLADGRDLDDSFIVFVAARAGAP
ncbi:MAG: hypothetical protein AAFR38_06550 [Planctomycetota bacterium]